MQDQAWFKLNQLMQLEKPLPLKNPKLRELVRARVRYPQNLTVRTQHAFFRLNDSEYVVPIWVKVENRDLTYKAREHGVYTAQLELYLNIQNLSGRTIRESDDVLYSHYTTEELAQQSSQYSAYQKLVRLPPGRFKIQVVIQNEAGEKFGISEFGLALPDALTGRDEADTSPIVLCQQLTRLLAAPENLTSFVIGNTRVVPSFDKVFGGSDEVGVYLQAYDLQTDQTSWKARWPKCAFGSPRSKATFCAITMMIEAGR